MPHNRKVAFFIAGRDFNLYRSRLPVMLALKKRGWEVHGLSVVTKTFEIKLNDLGIITHDLPINRHGFSLVGELMCRGLISKLIKRHSPSLIHFFNPKPILLGALLSRRVARPFKKYCTVTGAGFANNNSLKSKLISKVYSIALSTYDGITFENSFDAENLRQNKSLINIPYTIQISSGVDTSVIIPSFNQATYPIKFFFASRLLWSKGIKELLLAGQILNGSYAGKFKIVIAGELEPKHRAGVPREIFSSANLDRYIDFIGHISLENMPEYLSNSDVVVLPSYREGFSKFLMEGAAAGKPLITSNIPGCRETVDEGVNGHCVEPRDAEKLASAMSQFISKPDKCADYGKHSRNKAESEFDSKVIVSKTLEFYEKNNTCL